MLVTNKKKQGVIVVSTFSDERSARKLGKKVLESRLCACVNITKVQSMYLWKQRLEDQQEFLALFKTTAASAPRLKRAIAELHPYEVPEIVELKMTDISRDYLSWLVAETSSAHRVSQKRNDAAKR